MHPTVTSWCRRLVTGYKALQVQVTGANPSQTAPSHYCQFIYQQTNVHITVLLACLVAL